MSNPLLMPLKIGDVQLDNPLILAPMAGVTDLPFRLLCREMGAALVCMEMVSAKAIYYKNKNTEALMEIDPKERPVSLQLFGSDPDIIGEMAKKIEERPFDILDFNMGCPVPKVVNNHEGSALMKEPALVRQILTAMTKAVKKPVTVKIRKGFDDDHVNAVEIAKIAEDCGVAAIAVHGRTREQYYSGKADWDIIRQVKEAVSIPVIGNGDVTDAKSALALIDETGCDGIMIGRGAKGNPFIFRRILAAALNEELSKDGADIFPGEKKVSIMKSAGLTEALLERDGEPDREELRATILRHAKMMCECKGEQMAIRQMRSHIAWYSSGLPHSAGLRRKVNETETLEELTKLLFT